MSREEAMTTYDEKIFDFLTKPENWTVAREVNNKIETIKGKLIKDFWSEVQAEVRQKLISDEWNCDNNEEPALVLKRTTWNNLFAVKYGDITARAWLAIWSNPDSTKSLETYSTMCEIFREVDKRLDRSDDRKYPRWTYTKDHFAQYECIDKILPLVRGTMVTRYSSFMVEIAQKADPVITKLIMEYKLV
jgi:hypothetical protein